MQTQAMYASEKQRDKIAHGGHEVNGFCGSAGSCHEGDNIGWMKSRTQVTYKWHAQDTLQTNHIIHFEDTDNI